MRSAQLLGTVPAHAPGLRFAPANAAGLLAKAGTLPRVVVVVALAAFVEFGEVAFVDRFALAASVVVAKFSVVAVVGAVASNLSFFCQYSLIFLLLLLYPTYHLLACLIFLICQIVLSLLAVVFPTFRLFRLFRFSGTSFVFWRPTVLARLRLRLG